MEKESVKKRNSKGTTAAHQRRAFVQLWCSVLLLCVGSVLLICGFNAPPHGEIHSSVLIAFGEILTFVGALFGIDYHYKFTGR